MGTGAVLAFLFNDLENTVMIFFFITWEIMFILIISQIINSSDGIVTRIEHLTIFN